MPLAGDWELWRDFAVRSAGFPVSGLDVFGPGDESGRLARIASGARFQEAVTWQNTAALANAVLKVSERSPAPPSDRRRREQIVASYWQRYCGKNDTIGFFGPLAWGRVTDDGPPLRARAGALERRRDVHLESWAVQALAEAIDPEITVAAQPYPEDDLRATLAAHPPGTRARERGLAALARLEAARDAVAAAPPESLRAALADLDAVFVEVTGRDAHRNPGMAYGGRTVCYVDSLRDLDVAIGPGLVAAIAPALRTLFEACRWFTGRVNAIGRRVVERAADGHDSEPFPPVMGAIMRELMGPPPELGSVVAELHRRLAGLLADPDPATIGDRATAAFADHEPAWRPGVFQSVDIQIAARDEAAIAAGDYLAVVGDVHPGANPLIQGLFAHRHPDIEAFERDHVAAVGAGLPVLMPPWSPTTNHDGRGMPRTTADMVHIAAMPQTRAQARRRTWLAHELLVDGHNLIDRGGELRVPLVDVFWLPIFVSGARTFTLLPHRDHAERVTIGRCAIRREGWSIPATEIPERADELPAFARASDAAAAVREVADRAQADVPGRREPGAVPDPVPPCAAGGRSRGGAPDGLHRDASRPGRVLARRPGRQPLRRRATPRRRRAVAPRRPAAPRPTCGRLPPLVLVPAARRRLGVRHRQQGLRPLGASGLRCHGGVSVRRPRVHARPFRYVMAPLGGFIILRWTGRHAWRLYRSAPGLRGFLPREIALDTVIPRSRPPA